METPNYVAQIIFGAYIPFVVALVGISVPLVTVLLSVFAQGRVDIANSYQEDIVKITGDIAAKRSNGTFFVFTLMGKLIRKQYLLTLLNPNFYLVSLVLTPMLAIGCAIAALSQNFYFYVSASVLFLLIFFVFLRSLIKTIAEITIIRDSKKEERERTVIESLQTLIQELDPSSARVKKAEMTLNRTQMSNGDTLPSVTLGREFSWKMSLNNKDELPAKKAELGIQFPADVFDIKRQNGYDIYEPANIVRFHEEYIQKRTNRFFSPDILVTPRRTGTYEILAWIKGENVETKYLTFTLTVEMEA